MLSSFNEAVQTLHWIITNTPFVDRFYLKERVPELLELFIKLNATQYWEEEYYLPVDVNEQHHNYVTYDIEDVVWQHTANALCEKNKHIEILAAKLENLHIHDDPIEFLLRVGPLFEVILSKEPQDNPDRIVYAVNVSGFLWDQCLHDRPELWGYHHYNAIAALAIQDLFRAMIIWIEHEIMVEQQTNALTTTDVIPTTITATAPTAITATTIATTTTTTTTITTATTPKTATTIQSDHHHNTSEMMLDNKLNDKVDQTIVNTSSSVPTANSTADAHASTTVTIPKTGQFLRGDRGGISTVNLTAIEKEDASHADEGQVEEIVLMGDDDIPTTYVTRRYNGQHIVISSRPHGQSITASSINVHQHHDHLSVVSTHVTLDHTNTPCTIPATIGSNDFPLSSIVHTRAPTKEVVHSKNYSVSSSNVTQENRAVMLSSPVDNTANVNDLNSPTSITHAANDPALVKINPTTKKNNHTVKGRGYKKKMSNEKGDIRTNTNTTSHTHAPATSRCVGPSHVATSTSHESTPLSHSDNKRNNNNANTVGARGANSNVIKSVRFIDNNNKFTVLSENDDSPPRKTLKPGYACIWDIVYDGIKPTGARFDTRAASKQQNNISGATSSLSSPTRTKPQQHTHKHSQTHTRTHTHKTPVVQSHNHMTRSSMKQTHVSTNNNNTTDPSVTTRSTATKPAASKSNENNENNNTTKSNKANNNDNIPLNTFLGICSRHYFAFQRQRERNYKMYAKKNSTNTNDVNAMPINTNDDSIYKLCANVINSAEYKQALTASRN